MKKTALLLVLLCALVTAASAGATSYGVAEDATKYADDGGLALDLDLVALGMTQNRIAVYWDAQNPTTIQEKAFLDRYVPVAAAQGIKVIFAVYPAKARAIGDSETRRQAFAAYLEELVAAYPQVHDYIVGNEPNQPRFWQPQFVGTHEVAGAAYERLLAESYDALKAADPTIRVIGVGLSPRGNDRWHARNNRSTSPVRFLAAMGRAYRASNRIAPLMDALAYHTYPLPGNTQPLLAPHAWPNAGWGELYRVKQAFWDAFHDTPQRTLVEDGVPLEDTIQMLVDEVGWQARVPRDKLWLYQGHENVTPVSPATQAATYAQIVAAAACDPSIDSVDFFHLVDETDLERFQSGLMLADGTPRPAFAAVRTAIGAAQDGCLSETVGWRHSLDLVGGHISLTPGERMPSVTYTAGEGFVARTYLLPASASLDELADPTSVEALAKGRRTAELLPYRFYDWRAGMPAHACYRYGVILAAALDRDRTHAFLSSRFCT